MAVCGWGCRDINNNRLKILGTIFLQWKIKRGKNFYKTITDIQRVLNISKMRNLTLEGQIVIFKTIAISEIVFQPFPKTYYKWTSKNTGGFSVERLYP